MSETSDPQAEYTRLPDGNFSVETGTGTTLFAPPLTEATGEGEKTFRVLTAEERAAIKQAAQAAARALADESVPLFEMGRLVTAFHDAAGPAVALGTLAYVEHLEAEATTLRTRLQEAEDAGAAKDAEMAKLGGAGWLMNLLRYCASEDLDYIFDKLSRRCPAGKATRDHEQELKQQLRDERQEATALRAKLAREGEQEAQLLKRDKERQKLHRAILVASSGRLSADEREAYASNTNGQGTRGAYGAGEIMGRVSLAQDLLALFRPETDGAALPLQGEEGKGGGRG